MLLESDASNWYTVDVAVGAAVISLIAAGFTALQWWEARCARITNQRLVCSQAEALKEQAKFGRESLEQARRSADAAELSANASRVLADTGLRARFTVEDYRILGRSNEQFPIDLVEVRFKNVGSTPAIRVRTIARFATPRRGEERFNWDAEHADSRPPIGPGDVCIAPLSVRAIPPETKRLIIAGDSRLFVYGVLIYCDVFTSVPHEMRCCVVYDVHGQQFVYSPEIAPFQVSS